MPGVIGQRSNHKVPIFCLQLHIHVSPNLRNGILPKQCNLNINKSYLLKCMDFCSYLKKEISKEYTGIFLTNPSFLLCQVPTFWPQNFMEMTTSTVLLDIRLSLVSSAKFSSSLQSYLTELKRCPNLPGQISLYSPSFRAVCCSI